ncbi:MAG: hypothetical protein IKW16_02020, partial [Clostridia bacterium]|nr:hypothetical protein [Clostridia bacterium]
MKKSIKIIFVAVIVAVVLATCVACSGDRTYQDFTDAEKAMFNGFIGEVIPFLPNDEYYVEVDYDAEVMGDYLFYYTFDNTKSEFRSYLKDLEEAGFVAGETEKDMYGDTWYYYSKGDVKLKVGFYRYEGYYTMDVFVYYGVGYDLDGDDGADKPNFNDDEKSKFISVIGEAIPFMSSD